MKKFLLSTLCLVLFHFSTTYTLESTNEAFSSAEKEFAERWKEFQGGTKQFSLWNHGWNIDEIKKRFDQMNTDRYIVYFVNPEQCDKEESIGLYRERYQTPKDWMKWGSRYPYPGAFVYNLANENYSASRIILNGRKFLALEAPTKENASQFYEVLLQYQVTDLVRLTPASSPKKDNCFPYWEGQLSISKKNGRNTIELCGREMNYFFTDRWINHDGIEPLRLIALVKAVMENEGQDQVIGVHCRAGVGRTGVFLAAYTLIRDIDDQLTRGITVDTLKLSIDKVIWQLSLQRPFMVNNFLQYATLYQTIDTYIDSIRNKSKPAP